MQTASHICLYLLVRQLEVSIQIHTASSMQRRKKTKKKTANADVPTVERLYSDVVLGRGSGILKWPGNVLFRHVIWAFRPKYRTTNNRSKRTVAAKVLSALKSMDPPIRFIEMVSGNAFVEVDEKRALEKICQALREKKAHPPKNSPDKLCDSLAGNTFELQQSTNAREPSTLVIVQGSKATTQTKPGDGVAINDRILADGSDTQSQTSHEKGENDLQHVNEKNSRKVPQRRRGNKAPRRRGKKAVVCGEEDHQAESSPDANRSHTASNADQNSGKPDTESRKRPAQNLAAPAGRHKKRLPAKPPRFSAEELGFPSHQPSEQTTDAFAFLPPNLTVMFSGVVAHAQPAPTTAASAHRSEGDDSIGEDVPIVKSSIISGQVDEDSNDHSHHSATLDGCLQSKKLPDRAPISTSTSPTTTMLDVFSPLPTRLEESRSLFLDGEGHIFSDIDIQSEYI